MAPIFFDYKRTPLSLKKTHIALNNFNTYLKRTGTKYAATGSFFFKKNTNGKFTFEEFVSKLKAAFF